MSALGYAAGGLGQGLLQGKQFAMQRQNQLFEQGIKGREQALAEKAQSQQNALAQHAQDRDTWQQLSSIVHDPNFNMKYTPADQAKYIQSWHGFLGQHPEWDFGNEMAGQSTAGAPPATGTPPSAPAPQGAEPSSTDFVSNLGPQVNGQNAPGPQGQAPAPGPTVGVISQQAPQAPQSQPTPQTSAQQFPNAAWEAGQVKGAIPVGGAPDANSNPWYARADSLDEQANGPGITPQQKLDLQAQALNARNQGVLAEKAAQEALLAGNQAKMVIPQAQAGIAQAGAQTHETNVRAGLEPGEAASTERLQGAQTRLAGVQAAQEPIRTQQAQQQIELQRSGQQITRDLGNADIKIRQRGLDQAMKQFGFTKEQFAITEKGLLAGAAKTQAEAFKLMQDPNFQTQTLIKMIEDNRYTKSPDGNQFSGASSAAAERLDEITAAGHPPTLADTSGMQYVLTGQGRPSYLGQGGGSQGGGGVDVNGLLSSPNYTPSQKVQFLKMHNIPIPPALQRQAAQQVRGGGGSPRPVTAGGQ